jgi:N-acetylmuramoyl-L-alanine amidase
MGTRGPAVIDVQVRLSSLGYTVDPGEHGLFGPTTERAVREFQRRRQLVEDGVVEGQTWGELVEAGYSLGDRVLYLRYPSFRGDDVLELQSSLSLLGFDSGRQDGIFGPRTERAVRDFQRNVGLPLDGIVGATTLEALRRLRPIGTGPDRASVREAEQLRRLSTTITGARIAIDPGPTSVEGTNEGRHDAHSSLAAGALVAELRTRGAAPFVLRSEQPDRPDSDRARDANEAGAEVFVGIRFEEAEGAEQGAMTAYYGRGEWHSQGGRRLAQLITDALTTRLGLADLGAQPRALAILRETRMPAVEVHLHPGSLGAAADGSSRLDHATLRRLAVALADAIEGYFAGPGGDPAAA